MAPGDDEGEVLTRAAYEQIETELAELEGPKRAAAVQAIATARAHGDLSENFEYHAAKNEQGLLEARIRVLRHRLQHATVVDEAEAAASGVVTVGSRVELERDDGTQRGLAGPPGRTRAARQGPRGRDRGRRTARPLAGEDRVRRACLVDSLA